MSAPDFIIDRTQRTRAGALPTAAIQQIRRTLTGGGCVVVPSDTCYSLGVMAASRNAHEQINAILNRKKMPISLAFPSLLTIQQFVEVDLVSAILLERYTPGPITVVCKAYDTIPAEFLSHTIASPRGTVGVRIPDSWIERDVAACIPRPLTTVAVREPDDAAVRHFQRAVELVEAGMRRVGRPIPWGAVEGDVDGDGFYAHHSTVVEAVTGGPRRLHVWREGDIPVEELEATARLVPQAALER
jgi:L-threonylcarbamoyladenylate synthase